MLSFSNVRPQIQQFGTSSTFKIMGCPFLSCPPVDILQLTLMMVMMMMMTMMLSGLQQAFHPGWGVERLAARRRGGRSTRQSGQRSRQYSVEISAGRVRATAWTIHLWGGLPVSLVNISFILAKLLTIKVVSHKLCILEILLLTL